MGVAKSSDHDDFSWSLVGNSGDFAGDGDFDGSDICDFSCDYGESTVSDFSYGYSGVFSSHDDLMILKSPQ